MRSNPFGFAARCNLPGREPGSGEPCRDRYATAVRKNGRPFDHGKMQQVAERPFHPARGSCINGVRLARQALCVEAQRLVTVPRSEAPSFSAVRTCQQTVADSILAIRSSSMPVAIGERPDAWNAVRSRRTLSKAFVRYRSRSLALVGQIDESTHSLILDGASAGQVASPDRVARSLMA